MSNYLCGVCLYNCMFTLKLFIQTHAHWARFHLINQLYSQVFTSLPNFYRLVFSFAELRLVIVCLCILKESQERNIEFSHESTLQSNPQSLPANCLCFSFVTWNLRILDRNRNRIAINAKNEISNKKDAQRFTWINTPEFLCHWSKQSKHDPSLTIFRHTKLFLQARIDQHIRNKWKVFAAVFTFDALSQNSPMRRRTHKKKESGTSNWMKFNTEQNRTDYRITNTHTHRHRFWFTYTFSGDEYNMTEPWQMTLYGRFVCKQFRSIRFQFSHCTECDCHVSTAKTFNR